LTDLITAAIQSMSAGDRWPVEAVEGAEEVSVGVNTRKELAQADARVRQAVRDRLMVLGGVSMIAPETIYIDESVQIGQDTTLLPGCVILGDTIIGSGCTIGPYAIITNATIGDRVVIRNSTIEDCSIASDSDAGPYAHVRGNTVVGEHVHIGNFAELKNAQLDEGAKVGHFSYLGDVHVGARVNIGADTITANFDGTSKHHTEIAADSFIGSDTILIAPVEVEQGGRTGAGSVVTRSVEAGQTVVGVPARPIASRRRSQE
jgi:bifunctional UDP-N-acetylglucosamine pyrophosphorylase / glucosamine-1-phosphate N-acetyltransferase